MADRSFKHHLSPHELARRQRWVAVGVAILAFLLIGTWLVTLPGRISGYSADHTWNAWWGKTPNTTYIDIEEMMKAPNEETEKIQQVMRAVQTATSTAASAPAVTPTTISTSTVNLLKQKLK